MENEIKVGEYVRTDKGYIFTVDAERKVLSGLKFLDVQYGNIVKHDFDIKKIVEIGDYVNGHRVAEINKNGISYAEEVEGQLYDIGEIKSIVTHQQFKSIEYTIHEREEEENEEDKV